VERTHPVQDFVFLAGEVLFEPAIEERRDGVGETQHDIPGEARASLRGGRQDCGYLVVRQRRDDRRREHAGRHPGIREGADGFQALLR